jgi:hypothetical protein
MCSIFIRLKLPRPGLNVALPEQENGGSIAETPTISLFAGDNAYG